MKNFLRSIAVATLVYSTGSPLLAAVSGIEGPWSILVGGAVPSQATDGYFMPILISSLDGESPTTYSVVTKPGEKQVLLDTPRTANDRAPSHKRMELDMAPCMRYYVAGKKSAAASLRWTPEVFRVEPIGECVAEFKLDNKADSTTSPQKIENGASK